MRRSHNLRQASQVVGESITDYSDKWIIGRLGCRTPNEARDTFAKQAA